MQTVSYVIIGVFLCILPVYLKAEKSFGFPIAMALKLLLSALFVVNGIICFKYAFIQDTEVLKNVYYYSQVIITVGLIFAFFGGGFLQYIKKDKKKFHAGLVFLSITQILFLVSMTMNYGYSYIDLLAAIVPIGFVVFLLNKQNWNLGEERIFLSIYSMLLSFMVAKAYTSMFVDFSTANIVFALGATLFYASYALLAMWGYYKAKRIYANLNWISYFLGLILISLSLMFR